MKKYAAENRHDYPLTPASVIMDVGMHEGNFAVVMCEQYGCRIEGFEPIKEFAEVAALKLARYSGVTIHPYALGDSNRRETWSLKGAMTSFHSAGTQKESVEIRDIADFMSNSGWRHVDLLKLNCEGSEYEILERLLECNPMRRFANIQIQWHACVPNFFMRRAEINVRLNETHELTWQDPDFDTGHENWHLRS